MTKIVFFLITYIKRFFYQIPQIYIYLRPKKKN